MSERLGTICRIGLCAFVLVAYTPAEVSGASKNLGTTPLEGRTGQKSQTYYGFLYLGGLDSNETTQILDHETDTISAGGGWGWGFHPFLTFELDANLQSSNYDLPRGVGRPDLGDDYLELSTAGVLGNVKIGPRLGRLRPHIGVGLGLGVIDVSVTNPELWLPIPLETELSILTQTLAGLDLRVSRRSYLGIEFRDLAAHRKIDFGGEQIEAGGQSVVLVWRRGM